MTGKELILYILENNLEDSEIFKDGRFLDFLTVSEAAVKFNVGEATVMTWLDLRLLNGFKVGNVYYIPRTSEPSDKMLKYLNDDILKKYVDAHYRKE